MMLASLHLSAALNRTGTCWTLSSQQTLSRQRRSVPTAHVSSPTSSSQQRPRLLPLAFPFRVKQGYRYTMLHEAKYNGTVCVCVCGSSLAVCQGGTCMGKGEGEGSPCFCQVVKPAMQYLYTASPSQIRLSLPLSIHLPPDLSLTLFSSHPSLQ